MVCFSSFYRGANVVEKSGIVSQQAKVRFQLSPISQLWCILNGVHFLSHNMDTLRINSIAQVND